MNKLSGCVAVMGSLASPVAASDWETQVSALKERFAHECQAQQTTGQVLLDYNDTLREINNRIEAVLNAAGITVVKNRNGERFYATSAVYIGQPEADVVINNQVGVRFPTCRRSTTEFMTN